ncbi:DUF3857 domain-containing protein [Flavobacterium chungbukense]|uniref:DUF3857 domain-containing protein n=1 Tax=Flavobacterium chungbukense TaxID=877464 RepID=A0ABP7YDQ5_9FLAO|nr:DUF3857 domain-containing protein [Flavobacterium chungbukense]MCC4923593.1 DUF3857 domain-containing protein [Flavobacterium chungbukense]
MNSRSLAVFFFLVFSFTEINAQKFELGKVTVEELKEKENPKDTSAPAAILFKKGRTFFTYNEQSGFLANHVYEFRVKIYKKEGLSWATQKVSYYVGYENLRDDKVTFSDAATYNLENGAIIKTKLNSEGSFKEKVNKNWNVASIALPNVKVGSVIEFKYTLKSEDLVRLPDFDFQYEIPVNYFEYKSEIPEFFIYKTLLVGTYKPEMNADIEPIKQIYGSNYKQINSFYSGVDVPALQEENFVNNINNFKGSIQNELELKRFPDKPVVNYTKTWEGLAESTYKDADFAKELSNRSFYEEDLKKLLLNVNSPRHRLDTIFKFVQNRMNWNKKKGYYVDKGVKKAYEEKTGNTAEINLLLISMLKTAKIQVSPVLVSTIENGVPVFPNRTVFNYLIAAAQIDGEQILLDATSKFTVPNILPLNVLNWKGRLIKENGTSEEVELIPTKFSVINNTVSAFIEPQEAKLEGSLSLQKTDYNALIFREKFGTKTNASNIEKLEQQFNGIAIEDYRADNQDLSRPVTEKASFSIDKAYDVIGGKLFVNPLLFFSYKSNPFKLEKRQMPIYFGFPEQRKFNLFLQIPEGYVVESLPSPIRIVMEDKAASYTMNIMSDENQIQIKVTQEISKAIFAAEDYDMIKDFFQRIIEIQNDKIILKKT